MRWDGMGWLLSGNRFWGCMDYGKISGKYEAQCNTVNQKERERSTVAWWKERNQFQGYSHPPQTPREPIVHFVLLILRLTESHGFSPGDIRVASNTDRPGGICARQHLCFVEPLQLDLFGQRCGCGSGSGT
jgi:hypothetical protein